MNCETSCVCGMHELVFYTNCQLLESPYHACCLARLVKNVQRDPSVQTLQALPLNAQMGLTAWVLQPVA